MSNRNVPDAVQFDRDTTAIEHMHDLWQALGGRSLPTVAVHLLVLASEQYSVAHCPDATPLERASAANAYSGLVRAAYEFIVKPPFGAGFVGPDDIHGLVEHWISSMPASADGDAPDRVN